jgi:hypothetical protein
MRGILWRVIAAPSFAAFSASATMPVQPGGPMRLHPPQVEQPQRAAPAANVPQTTQPSPGQVPGARRGAMLDISV